MCILDERRDTLKILWSLSLSKGIQRSSLFHAALFALRRGGVKERDAFFLPFGKLRGQTLSLDFGRAMFRRNE